VKRPWLIIFGCIFILLAALCGCALVIAGITTFNIFNRFGSPPTPVRLENPGTPTQLALPLSTIKPPGLITATPVPPKANLLSPTPSMSETSTTEPQNEPTIVLTDTLETLENTIVPVNDLNDLAKRFLGIENIPATVPPPVRPYQVGDTQVFWVSDTDTNENFQIDATLQYITDHVYFWIENGVLFNRNDLKNLVETFETKIYPTDREFFGSEWTPGVDDDPHLYIVYAGNLGSNLAGYFSSADEYNPLAHKYSNAHEMFLINSDNVGLGERYIYSTLAHEFQHMIHWYRDRNESSWLNEGFSELAALLNGYYDSGFDYLYAQDPDLQLNDWPNDPSATTPHYGASFLFLSYFLDRFGEKATQSLVGEPSNGMESVDAVLKDIEAVDTLTNLPVRADDVFTDWAITNYVLDPSVGDGRFDYYRYQNAPQVSDTETIRNCNNLAEDRQVHQYGVDYVRFRCSGNYTLHFDGSDLVGVLPVDAYSGSYAFWSNKGDESDMTLTHTFDFTNTTGPISMNFHTWYDLEKDYDYLYVTVSEDGQNWKILRTPSGTDQDPSGNSYGWGYNGLSGEGKNAAWIDESVDLSDYAGKNVQVRFEYVTDAAVNGEGFLLDDISIPQINYFSDFETDQGGWEPSGWVRIQNTLPQTFRLALITEGNTTNVEYIPLSTGNTADITLNLGGDVNEATLMVAGTTRFTRQEADYQLAVKP
jgi:immune inhibitor A